MHDRTNSSFGAARLRLLIGVFLIAGLSSAAAQGPGPTKHGAWATPRAGLPSSELLKRADASLLEAARTVGALEARLQRPHRSGAGVANLVSGLAGVIRHMQAWRVGLDDGSGNRAGTESTNAQKVGMAFEEMAAKVRAMAVSVKGLVDAVEQEK